MSKRLDWSRITPDVAIWCQTEEEDIAFRKECKERGMTWRYGQKPLDTAYFSKEAGYKYNIDGDIISGFYAANTVPYSCILVEDKPRTCESCEHEMDMKEGKTCRCNQLLRNYLHSAWEPKNDKPAKSRLEDILGVEEDEEWEFAGDTYRIHDGKRQYNNGSWHDCGNESDLCYIINHPDSIIRKPRFTPDELAMLRCFKAAGVTKIEREKYGNIVAAPYDWMYLLAGLLPSLLIGQSIELAEVPG